MNETIKRAMSARWRTRAKKSWDTNGSVSERPISTKPICWIERLTVTSG